MSEEGREGRVGGGGGEDEGEVENINYTRHDLKVEEQCSGCVGLGWLHSDELCALSSTWS